jgi:hypothetical protein
MKESLLREAKPSEIIHHTGDWRVGEGKYVGALVAQTGPDTFKVFNRRTEQWETYSREGWAKSWKQKAPMMVEANLGRPMWCIMRHLERTYVFDDQSRPWNRRLLQVALDKIKPSTVEA